MSDFISFGPGPDPGRAESSRIYSTQRWRRLRKQVLHAHPLCAVCERPADVVHHIRPVDQRPDLAFRADNLQALCRDHHEALHGRGKRGKG